MFKCPYLRQNPTWVQFDWTGGINIRILSLMEKLVLLYKPGVPKWSRHTNQTFKTKQF